MRTPTMRAGASLLLMAATFAQTPVWFRRTEWAWPAPIASSMSLAFDSDRGVAVLVGLLGTLAFTVEWDGTRWVDRTTTGPAAPTIVYDSLRKVVVGSTGGETWEWNGTAWTKKSITNPPSRGQFGLVYDSVRNKTVLFGGQDGTYTRSDTWEYDGSAWVLRTTGGPPPRTAPALAFDAARGVVVVFGGEDQKGQPRVYGDTWEWNGTYWVERLDAGGPGGRRGMKSAFDVTLGRTVLYGGASLQSGPFADTWEWDGLRWKDRSTAKGPPAMSGHAMCFDSRRGRVLLFASVQQSNVYVPHFWERFTVADPQARWSAFGAGCAGSAGAPTLAPEAGQLPWIGETFVTKIGNVPAGALRVPFGLLGASKTAWNGVPLPFDLGAIGMAGCTLLVGMDSTFTLTAVAGTATWSLPIPPEPAFVGAALYQQAVVLDPGANVLGATVSNAGELTVGVR